MNPLRKDCAAEDGRRNELAIDGRNRRAIAGLRAVAYLLQHLDRLHVNATGRGRARSIETGVDIDLRLDLDLNRRTGIDADLEARLLKGNLRIGTAKEAHSLTV